MILDRKHFSLLVQVIDRDNLNAADDYAEGRVLNNLEYVDNLGNQLGAAYMIRDPILLTPVGTSKDLEDVDTG